MGDGDTCTPNNLSEGRKRIRPPIFQFNCIIAQVLVDVKVSLSFIFTFAAQLMHVQHISVSKSCFLNIRDLRRIRRTIDRTTACTIAASLIHFKIDYCNSLLLNLRYTPVNRLYFVLKSAAYAFTRTPKFDYITPILKSLYWLAINQSIQSSISLTNF